MSDVPQKTPPRYSMFTLVGVSLSKVLFEFTIGKNVTDKYKWVDRFSSLRSFTLKTNSKL